MIMNLIITFLVGVGVTGLIFGLYRMAKRKPPRWMLPAAAGLSMIGFQAWNEYSWFSRTADLLPDTVEIGQTYANASLLQPWTYIAPRVDRFSAIDRATVRRNPQAPGFALAEVLLIGRLAPTAKTLQIFDCEMARRADITAATEFGDDGLPKNLQWVEVEADDALRRIACSAK
ncbi:MAG: hypothetical protein R3D02_15295 [Hyphomicrobiales bacterium]